MSDRPNILWYCTDQQRFDTIGALNNPYINTPHLDAFMQQSTTFSHAFCQAPICTPSRASFLTGSYPGSLGVDGNGNANFPRHLENRLITHRLARAGYDCGLVGKLHLASPAQGQETRVNDGYRYFQYSHDHKGPDVHGHDYAEWIRTQGSDPATLMTPYITDTYRDGAKVKTFGGLYAPTADQDNIPPHLHQTNWCTEKATAFINENRHSNQPWLLSVNPFDPHPPFDAPWDYYKRYNPATLPGAHFVDSDLEHQKKLAAAGIDFQSQPQHPDAWEQYHIQASYYAMIEQLDHEFGRLLNQLELSGQRHNTIIIFTSDHGETLADHGLVLKGCRFFEGLVRVPLMISWPGHFQQNIISDALVELVDLVPTFYDVLDMEMPYYMHGRPLTPLLTGATTTHRNSVRTEFYGAIDFPDQTHATMYRDHRWKLNIYHNKNLCELYDLENDPWEHQDLSNDPAYQDKKYDLMQHSFDATVYAHPLTPPRSMPF